MARVAVLAAFVLLLGSEASAFLVASRGGPLPAPAARAANGGPAARCMQRDGRGVLRGFGVGVLGAAVLVGASPCFAEGRSGPEIFSQKCANCHKGGSNTVVGAGVWTLQTDALQRYGYDDVDSIIELLSKGKKIEADGRLMTDPGHPGYAGKSKKRGLLPAEIETISNYVLEQAEAGWPANAPGATTDED